MWSRDPAVRFALGRASARIAVALFLFVAAFATVAGEANAIPTYEYDAHGPAASTLREDAWRTEVSLVPFAGASGCADDEVAQPVHTGALAVGGFLAPQGTAGDDCDGEAWVIGESYRWRTKPAADSMGAQAWPGLRPDSTHNEVCAANETWLRSVIARGAKIIDLGIDNSRQDSRSPYYRLELRIIAETGYPA